MAKYWRSLEELYEKPEFQEYLHREFPQAASLAPEGVSRRRWLQIMGASLAMAGATGCRWEDEKIVTHVSRPANRTPGVPVKYASVLERSGVALGVLVTSYDGRPIKIDVNPDHPQNFTGTDATTQGYILQMYDPDRIARDVKTGRSTQLYNPKDSAVLRQKSNDKRVARTWNHFQAFAAEWWTQAKQNSGAGIRFLSGANSSPSLERLRNELKTALPQAKWVEYEPVSRDHESTGVVQALRSPVRLRYQLEEADVILGLDSDLLDFHPESPRHIRQWASRRAPENGTLNRTYSVESCYTGLGQGADHRLPLSLSQIGTFVNDLLDVLQGALNGAAPTQKENSAPYKERFLASLVNDLISHQGRSVVVAGPRLPAEVHAACVVINSLLGNLGKTVVAAPELAPARPSHAQAITELVSEMNSGSVHNLVVLGGNPVYDVPAALNFKEALKKVSQVIRLGQYDDETSAESHWYLPQAHDLEAWGDGRSWEGTLSIRQPLLTPLHRGVSEIELLAILTQQEERDGLQIVRKTVESLVPGLTQRAWDKAIHDGFVSESTPAVITDLKLAEGAQAQIVSQLGELESQTQKELSGSDFEVIFMVDELMYDGRFANNAWLQETPSQLTKVTWDNVAVLSPKTAKALNVKDGDVVEVKIDNRTMTIPVYQMPGLADRTLGINMGYGRTAAGHIGGSLADKIDPVGSSVYEVMSLEGAKYFTTAQVSRTGRKHKLATTQDHWAIDVVGMEAIGHRIGGLVREGTTEEYNEHNDFAQHRVHHPPLKSLWEDLKFDGQYQWGMSIDLSRCIGCNACVVACQAENNVPVVGKDQVSRNREMHWVRSDRYFVSGDNTDVENEPENVGVSTMPVSCVHCENAPCEQVCPVAATVHSNEGLNDMVYNRCIGTRYCGNNCPYKVRRFNYFSNAKPLMKQEKELVQLVMNPEVTIRSRGVMEKCTYCVQRIQHAKIVTKNEGRTVTDQDLKVACQEVCSADAVVFGNLLDENSAVSKSRKNPRSYAMLAELNIRPRTEYLARLRNPHPWLKETYFLQPGSSHAHHDHDHDHNDDHGHKKEEGHSGIHHHDHDHDHDHDSSSFLV